MHLRGAPSEKLSDPVSLVLGQKSSKALLDSNFRTPDIPPGKMVERFGFVLSGCEPKPVRFLIFLS